MKPNEFYQPSIKAVALYGAAPIAPISPRSLFVPEVDPPIDPAELRKDLYDEWEMASKDREIETLRRENAELRRRIEVLEVAERNIDPETSG